MFLHSFQICFDPLFAFPGSGRTGGDKGGERSGKTRLPGGDQAAGRDIAAFPNAAVTHVRSVSADIQ